MSTKKTETLSETVEGTPTAFRQNARRVVRIDSLVAGPPIVAGRDMKAEQKIRQQLVMGLYTGALLATFTKTEVDDRLIARAIQRFQNDLFWSEWADDIWGPE